jgi:hypothetical protein
MKRLPVTNAYGGGFRPDVLDEIVQRSRNARRIVADPRDGKPRLLTERQMFDACQEHPEHFRAQDFGVHSYDVTNRPFYVYAKATGPHVHEPRPMLEEGNAPERSGETGGTYTISDFIRQPHAGDGAE